MIMNDMSIIVRHMRVFAERSMAGEGLGFPEQIVIMYLASHESSNQEQIASFLDIDKGAVAKTVAKLVAKGLVGSKTCESNRREKTLSLSVDGLRIVGRMREALGAWETGVFEGVDANQRRIIENTVARMAENSHAMIRDEN